MTSKNRLLSAALAMALSVWPGKGFAAQVRGSVLLEGPAPAPTMMTIKPKKGDHSAQGCGSLQKASQKLLVDRTGGVQNVVVWLDVASNGPGTRSNRTILLDQKECVFSPHVVVVDSGTTIAIRNSDHVLHNVRIFQEGKPAMLMHQWQKADASSIFWRFAEPGRYVVRCGVHPWMYAWVVVNSGAGAVTDGHGRFILSGVPPGKQTLHVWNEALGTREIPIVVATDEEILKPILLTRAEDS